MRPARAAGRGVTCVGCWDAAASGPAAGMEVARQMAKGKRSGSRGSASRRAGRAARRGAAPAGPPAGSRTFGLDPSWFAIRGQDTRGSIVQLASVGGLAVGLFVALDAFGSTSIGGSEQATQLAWLASIVGLAALPVAAAAVADAVVTWLARRGRISPGALGRAALLLPPLVAAIFGAALPLLLFAIGRQPLYLLVAGASLVVVVVAVALGYLRRWFATGADATGSEGDGA